MVVVVLIMVFLVLCFLLAGVWMVVWLVIILIWVIRIILVCLILNKFSMIIGRCFLLFFRIGWGLMMICLVVFLSGRNILLIVLFLLMRVIWCLMFVIIFFSYLWFVFVYGCVCFLKVFMICSCSKCIFNCWIGMYCWIFSFILLFFLIIMVLKL